MNLILGHYILAKWPIWLLALVLYVFCIGILWIGRDLLEGIGYNTAFSSQIGDMFLIVPVLICAGELQRRVTLPVWITGKAIHVACIALAATLGIIWQWNARRSSLWEPKVTAMDTYHNLVIAPILLYLLGISLPIILFTGSRLEKRGLWACIIVWALLVVFDSHAGRLGQRDWLLTHGFRDVLCKSNRLSSSKR